MSDIGSFVGDSHEYGKPVKYKGLSQDVGKLPHNVATGSTALCLDTGDLYIFHAPTDTWYKM